MGLTAACKRYLDFYFLIGISPYQPLEVHSPPPRSYQYLINHFTRYLQFIINVICAIYTITILLAPRSLEDVGETGALVDIIYIYALARIVVSLCSGNVSFMLINSKTISNIWFALNHIWLLILDIEWIIIHLCVHMHTKCSYCSHAFHCTHLCS